MSLFEMTADLPTACNVGTKRNSKGYKTSWIGYKFHIDACDGGKDIIDTHLFKIANQPNNHSADFELNRLARTDKNRQLHIMSDCYKSKYLKFSNNSPSTFCQADSEIEFKDLD